MANIGWGLQMTVLGMGLVFALLALLWALLNLALFFDRPAGGAGQNGAAGRARSAEVPPSGAASPSNVPNKDRVAAILIAVMRYRQSAPANRSRIPAGSDVHREGGGSNWQLAGRIRQNKDWQPGGKR